MDEYTDIYKVVQAIPWGRVASYGQVAILAGKPRWARVVGYAMRRCQNPAVPCHRVVYQDGTLSPAFGIGGGAEQRAMLESEGVGFHLDGRVDMARYGWKGSWEAEGEKNAYMPGTMHDKI